MLWSMLTLNIPAGGAGALSNHWPAVNSSLFTSVSR